MSYALRQALSAGAVTTLLAAGAALVGSPSPASAAEPTPACVAATAAVTTARAGLVTARHAYVAFERSTHTLMQVERSQARAEAASSRKAIRALEQQLHATHDKAQRAALRAQVRAEMRDVTHSRKLLTSRKALLDQVKADRAAAAAAFRAAKVQLHQAKVAERTACGDTTEPPEAPEPTQPTS